MNIKAANTILYCKKWPQTVAFYKNQLGLPVLTGLDWFVEFKLNETARLSIADEARASMVSNEGKGIMLTFEVDDIETAYSHLLEADVNPTQIKDHPWGAKVIYCCDPEGNRLEFWSPEITRECCDEYR